MIDYEDKRKMECEECGSTFEVKHEMGTHYIPQYCTFCAGEILPREERIDYDQEPTLNWQISESCYNSSMRFNKEFLYHFSCEKCENWWSYPATDNLNFIGKRWFCPHCSHEHNPPHIDQNALSEEQLRELVWINTNNID